MTDFVSNQKPQIDEILQSLGILSTDPLFDAIPPNLKHLPPTEDDGLSESELLTLMEKMALKNTFAGKENYLGAGAYEHYVPALVSAITSRSEFLTSYTPYQPEASQGILQAMFEFQSALAALTQMDVANAGVYDGASACAEGVLMALRLQKEKNRVLVADSVHPSYRKTLKLYLEGLNVEYVPIPFSSDGKLNKDVYLSSLDANVACVLLQSPNFFGLVEDMATFSKAAQEAKAISIVCGNPLAYALFAPPGEYEADIAVGDCQPIGLSLMFGGPYAGYMACREEYVRQLPGRIVGQTKDSHGKRGFVLTLQAREQHIRREKATSNICTNQTLSILASLVTMLWYGPQGLYELALTNYQRAHYLSSKLSTLSGFEVLGPHFNEFTLKLPCKVQSFLNRFQEKGIVAGIPLRTFYPEWEDRILIAVTELKSLKQLEQYFTIASQI